LEGEALIREHGYGHRNRHALFLVLRLGVERLAEFHDVQAALTQRRPDGRRRIGGARGHLQFDVTDYVLCHLSPPPFCGLAVQPKLSLLPRDNPGEPGTPTQTFSTW